MLQGRPREIVKRVLALSRARLVFDRITKTHHTRSYFLLSTFTCLILCALQAVILSDNTKAVEILTSAVDEVDPPAHVTILKDGELYVCDSIPDRRGTNCIVLWMSGSGSTNGTNSLSRRSGHARRSRARRQVPVPEPESEDSDDDGEISDDDDDDESDVFNTQTPPPPGPRPTPPPTATSGATSASPSSTVSVSTAGNGSTSVTFSSSSAPGATSVTFTQTPSASTSPASRTTTEPPASTSTTASAGNSDISLSDNSGTAYSMSCVYSMSWLEETLHDSQREDVATIFFQVWLFGLGFVAVLNESLPHLAAAFAGHVLAAAWSSSRISATKWLGSMYRDVIVAGPCDGVDMLGTWFELRLAHTIPVVVFNIVGLLGLGLLSYKLLRGYSAASFDRIGSAPALQRLYKFVLVFSVGLQLSGFFIAVSSGLWLSKVAHGNFKTLSHHAGLYIASFAVVLAAEIPWLIVGWVCVRRECKARSWMFVLLSAGLLSISGVMFGSDAYRTIFKSWAFFATITITSFVLLVFTVALGIVCYLNYGKGLREILQTPEEPEGADFDPVSLPTSDEKLERHFPQAGYYAPALHGKGDTEWMASQALPQPPSAAQLSQSISRTLPEPHKLASPNPFDSELDSLYDSHAPKSSWSANTSDIDARSFRTVASSETDALTAAPAFLLQPPPLSIVPPPGPRFPSFNGTVASLIPFEGMPVLPFTPVSSRRPGSSSTRSITRSPFPAASVRSEYSGREGSRRSSSSSSRAVSVRSIEGSPFALTPVTLAHTNTSHARDSGYPTSLDRSFYVESEVGSSIGSARQSVASPIVGEYQAPAPPGRRGTFGVESVSRAQA